MKQILAKQKRLFGNNASAAKLLLFIIAIVVISGCKNLGPNSIHSNRESYIEALSQTDKEEMLANIVRAKYNDPPKFLKIKTISAAPSVEVGTDGEAKVGFENYALIHPKFSFKESPTILYTPLMGTEYSTQLLMPMGLVNLFLMLNNGFDTEIICDLMIISINGKNNSRSSSDSLRNEFKTLIQAISRLSKEKLIHFATTERNPKDKEPEIVIEVTAEALLSDDFRYLADALDLDFKAGPIQMTFGFSNEENAVAVKTRSFLALINYLSNFVQVPAEHESIVWQGKIDSQNGLIHIYTSNKMPEDASTAVFLYNNWFYIKSTDIGSQNILYLIQILFELQAHIGSSSGNIQLTMPVR